jgi:hypothetical protein
MSLILWLLKPLPTLCGTQYCPMPLAAIGHVNNVEWPVMRTRVYH